MKRVFLCRHPEHTGEDDWTEIEAFDAEDAAETHAEYLFDQCDGWEYMANQSTPVLVKDGEKETQFSVYTEFYPSFSARKDNSHGK